MPESRAITDAHLGIGVAGRATVEALPTVRVVHWKRNLAALWVAEFMAIFGFSFALPFLPIFLHAQLGVGDAKSLATWTGLAGGAVGASMAVASPVWGWLADRQGRKSMLVRAMLGGAISVGLMSLVQSPEQLIGLRLLQGATSGTVAAATALVAAETPRYKVGWALGVLSSSVALGGAVAPIAGTVALHFIPMRLVFGAAGLLCVLSIIPVLLLVQEGAKKPEQKEGHTKLTLRGLGKATAVALGALIGGQALMQFAYASTQQMAVLRMLQIDPKGATVATGAAFAVAGAATTIASIVYSRITKRSGYRWFAAATAGLFAVAIGGCAIAPSLTGLVVSVGCFGLFYGGLNPALYSMIGLETPRAVQSTVYGLSASAIAVGIALGPTIAGVLAAVAGLPVSIALSAVVAVAAGVLVALAGREPYHPKPGEDSSSQLHRVA